MGGLGLGDIHGLSEQHQFILLLLSQSAAIVSMFFLYRSSPHTKKPGDPLVPISIETSGPDGPEVKRD